MHTTKRWRARQVALFSALCLAATAAASATASPAGNPPAATPVSAQMANTDEEFDGVEAQVAASMEGNGVTEAEARHLVELQDAQVFFAEEVGGQYSDTVGGFSLDVHTGTLHVRITPSFANKAEVDAIAAKHGIDITYDEAPWSIAELDAVAASINAEFGTEGVAATPDYETSTMLVSAPDQATADRVESRITSLSETQAANASGGNQTQTNSGASNGASIPVSTTIEDLADMPEDKCTDRFHCGGPLRSGISMTVPDGVCSIGFTATAADGSRWAFTAGHCGGRNSMTAHGEQRIGPIRQSFDYRHQSGYPGLDLARARIANSYWLSWPRRGVIFHPGSPDNLGRVTGFISINASYIKGHSVCLGGINVSSSPCGTISGFRNGLVAVKGYDACGGDSGGPWTRNVSGVRLLYGVHSGSDKDCYRNNASKYSYFTPMPLIRTYWNRTLGQQMTIDLG